MRTSLENKANPAPEGTAAGVSALGTLPRWDLTDLYPAIESPEIGATLDKAAADAEAFAARYKGKLAGLEGAALGRAVAEYEVIDEALSRVLSYADLKQSLDALDAKVAKFVQGVRERANRITTHLLFFTLELNRIDDARFAEQLRDPAAAHYAPWLGEVRAMRPHQLDDELERLLHDKYIAGRAAWNRLFDETMAGLRFPVDGRELTSAEALHLLSDPSPEVRRTAAGVIGKVLNDNIRLLALVTNTLAKDKQIEDEWRRFPRPVSARNLANQVEDAVVDALVTAVRAAFPRISHRYYAMKARWLGAETMPYWDRNAPLPDVDDSTIPWTQAQATVLGAYGGFAPAMAEIAGRFFDRGWIDAPVRAGKSSGAFAHPTVPSAHPYVLLNYQGKTRDVMTLAHELGHGVHQVLAAEQGHLLSQTPLTLAETASVFGEMLTFRAMLAQETDPRRRKAMLAGKVEDMINTVVRQIAFYEFERRVHDERREGELTADRIGEIWLEIQRESLGPAFTFDAEYGVYWSYIPHFVHTPFYVYAYAFGDCLVNSLYAVYQQGEPGFQERYFAMLKAGGTRRHRELLAPFGLDASDPAFWDKGLSVVEGLIDELAAMEG
ncbi:MAG: M3 family oligoendopeptidase [Alphaproteobacteria bacterium]